MSFYIPDYELEKIIETEIKPSSEKGFFQIRKDEERKNCKEE